MNNVHVKIIKPQFIPDCSVIVVWYVPCDLVLEFDKEKIKHNIISGNNTKHIHYSYEWKFNDFCFTVSDLTEYSIVCELR
jgi:hypothetical protein